ncbi:hypothetical protein C2G38_2172034 [Gigaspora rosea]|uniref:Uncharacterized protein n=1 Tax=Gigaspora rosea TaxID=44941 RepID=A0A397VMM3_9GLOM|nr:hypothetical protein C2G38_2172034 [Gigaspora rosea]
MLSNWLIKQNPTRQKEAGEVWGLIEAALLSTRALLLDALSYTSEQRQVIAIKSIYPNYQSKPEVEPLFGEDMGTIISKENEKNKFLMILCGKNNVLKDLTTTINIRAITTSLTTHMKEELLQDEDPFYTMVRDSWRIVSYSNNKRRILSDVVKVKKEAWKIWSGFQGA